MNANQSSEVNGLDPQERGRRRTERTSGTDAPLFDSHGHDHGGAPGLDHPRADSRLAYVLRAVAQDPQRHQTLPLEDVIMLGTLIHALAGREQAGVFCEGCVREVRDAADALLERFSLQVLAH